MKKEQTLLYEIAVRSGWTGGWACPQTLLNWIAENGEKQHFAVSTLETVTINNSPTAPSFFTDLILNPLSVGFELTPATGAVKNVSGRLLKSCSGTISFQPDKGVGGTTLLHLWSERSSDGVAWTQNETSLRSIEISNSGETFKTSVSGVSNWNDGEFVRFRCYAVSGGAIDFSSPTDTVLGGEVIVGSSILWELIER